MSDDAIPAGMVAWLGGDAAPADWDGGTVWTRNFDYLPAFGVCDWQHYDNDADIIAYTPTPSIVTGSDERAREVREAVAACLYGHLFLRIAYKPQHGRILNWPELPDDDYHRRLCLEVADGVLSLPALAASRPTDAGAGLPIPDDIPQYEGGDITYLEGMASYFDSYAKQKGRERLPASRDLFNDAAKRLRQFDVLLAALATPKPPVDEAMREALEPFADVGRFLEAETTGFDVTDDLCLTTEEGHLLARLPVGAFLTAIRNLTGDGAGA